MGTAIKHLRRTTSGAAGNGLGAAMKYMQRTTSAAAYNGDEEASNALQRGAAQAPKLTRWQPPGAQGEETKEAAKDALNFWAFPLEVRGRDPRLE
jgi:hypothetical protein